MTIDQSSMQISTQYAAAAVRSEPIRDLPINFDKLGEPLPLKQGTWEDMYHPQITETVEEDGSITQTLSMHASLAFIGEHYRGTSVLDCTISFNASSYQYGELGETVDLMAAAHEVVREFLKNSRPSGELEQKTMELEQVYETRKNETAASFAEMVDGVLDGEKTQSSIQALFVSCESKYRSLTLRTPDTWARAGIYEAALSLQKLGASLKPDCTPNGLYSLHELEGAALKARGGLNVKT